MNILKEQGIKEKNEYRKIYEILNFKAAWDNISSGVKSYRFFDISSNKKNYLSFSPKKNYLQLSNISNLSKIFNQEFNDLLLNANKKTTFNIRNKNKILCFLHLDLILAIEHLKKKDKNNKFLIEHLQLETGIQNILEKISHFNGTTKLRSNIYTTNKNSVVINMSNNAETKNLNKLSKTNLELINKNPLLNLIEIDNGFDNQKLAIFLNEMNEYCLKVINIKKIKQINVDNKFSLKIRKIKRTFKRGMYIANQNTIIIDPRHTDSFIHELGHWYHCNYQKEIKVDKEAENFVLEFVREVKL